MGEKSGWPHPKKIDCPWRDRPDVICRCQDTPQEAEKIATKRGP